MANRKDSGARDSAKNAPQNSPDTDARQTTGSDVDKAVKPIKPPSRFERLEAKIDAIVARLPEPPPKKRGHRFATWLETSWGTRIVAALGVWAIAITIGGFWLEMGVRAEERQARTEEAEFRRLAQIATAWEVLLTPVGGDIGKGNALNTLIAAGHEIMDSDFSCEAVGEYEDGECISPPVYNNVTTISGDFYESLRRRRLGEKISNTSFRRANFEGATIMNFSAADFNIAEQFLDVNGYRWRIAGATFSLAGIGWRSDWDDSLGGFECEYCEFYDSTLPLDFALRLSAAALVDTVVEVPIEYADRLETGANLGPGGGFQGRSYTFLHQPTVFVWSDLTAGELSLEASLVEVSQEYLGYCATTDDFRRLEEYWAAQRLTVLDPVGIVRLSEALRNLNVRRRPVDIEQDIDESATQFHCNLSYWTVEPILKPRLLEIIKRRVSTFDLPQNGDLSLEEYLERYPPGFTAIPEVQILE